MRKIVQFFQEKVVFVPVKLPKDLMYEFDYPFEEIFFETENNGRINAIHFMIENPKGIILYFHGNADNLIRWGKIAGKFTKLGYDVLVYDYRGYGKSTGERTEENLFNDAQFIYNQLKEKYSEQEIVIVGRSLGGAFATKIASDNLPKKVILECTFYNLQDMAERYIPHFLTKSIKHIVPYHFSSNEHIKKIRVPLYHFHGDKDIIVPLKSGKKLFETYHKYHPNLPQKFIEIKGADHGNFDNFEDYQTEIKKILE